MSTQEPLNIVTIDSGTDDNNALGSMRDHVEGELTHDNLEDMVDKVLKRAGENCIGQLDILGHGEPGTIVAGAERNPRVPGKRINGSEAEWETQLSRLKGKFCDGGSIRLIGCKTGVCDKGANKLAKLAKLLNVKACGVTRTIYGATDFDENGFKEKEGDIVCVNPGENPGCLTGEGGTRVGGLLKLPEDLISIPEVDGIVAMAVLKPGIIVDEALSYPIQDTYIIDAFINMIDFSVAYEGRGLLAVQDAWINIIYDPYITDRWSILFDYEAVEIVRNGINQVFLVEDPGSFKSTMEEMLDVQAANDTLYRNLLGLQTPSTSFRGMLTKEMKQIVNEGIDADKRDLSSKELLESPLTVIKGIGEVTAKELSSSIGVNSVLDLANLKIKTRWSELAGFIKTLSQM